jgi:N-carbamoyl-L-amino-acid hydrolase
MARLLAGIPTAMIFIRSLGGLSHTAEENSKEEDVWLGVEVLAETVAGAMS